MLTIDQIVDALRISRAEFGRIFVVAQIDLVANPADRMLFEGVAKSADDKQAFREALAIAQQGQFLEPFLHLISEENREDGSITKAFIEDAAQAAQDPQQQARLQAMTNLATGFQNPESIIRGMNIGMRWTVKVFVDGAPKGTGILIGPHLVMTAWHVVRDLFTPKAGGGFTAIPAIPNRLFVDFDDLSAGLGVAPPAPQRVAAHKQWYVDHSECHPRELLNQLPDNRADLEGFWDYTVFRLEKTPGLERRWAALDARAEVPASGKVIFIFQHPAAQPLRVDDNVILAPDTADSSAIPRLRFLHKVNGLGGSSGAPCFDTSFMLCGLHQGEWVPQHGETVNRGIPIVRIKEHIQSSIQSLPVPDPSETPVWKLSKVDLEAPVIGCDPFQSLVWRSAVAGKPRVLILSGSLGSGKTFRLSVLSAMLPDSGHFKIVIPANGISKKAAPDLAAVICRAAGAPVPTFVSNSEFNSTTSAWLRDELVAKIIQSLDQVRDGRLIWLALSDLDCTDIQGDNTSSFLTALYERTGTTDWLRIVLDGMKGDLPSTVRTLTEIHACDRVTLQDIATYLKRAIAEQGPPDSLVIDRLSNAAFRVYNRSLVAKPEEAMMDLRDTVMDFVGGP
jgi:Trypsin-like peptidase domain